MSDIHPGHFVAVVGGACAGSEAAFQLANRGIYVALFEQQALPYGKIEDGLPKWHVRLRNKEEGKIEAKISHPNIFYIPKARLGAAISFYELVNQWGFSAVLLAIGAWRDRPLPVKGIDEFIGKGFYYQNYFVDWFNHYHEPGYNRQQCEVADGAIVVGGGLASIDVIKILMLETVSRALAERGYKVDVISLEHGGIPKTLAELGVDYADLNFKGCTLFYRRRVIDMPLAPLPDDPAKIEKAQQIRARILKNAQEKYLFHFQDRSKPVDLIVENGRLAGLVFRRTEVVDGRVKDIPGSEFEVRAPLVISSIGSIPEPIPGIPAAGELFEVEDEATGKLKRFEHVFALGNAVTGRGNIRESELHARQVTQYVMDSFLNWRAEDAAAVQEKGWAHLRQTGARRVLTEDQIRGIIRRIRQLQQRVGYDGDYEKWKARHLPVRLEELVEKE